MGRHMGTMIHVLVGNDQHLGFGGRNELYDSRMMLEMLE